MSQPRSPRSDPQSLLPLAFDARRKSERPPQSFATRVFPFLRTLRTYRPEYFRADFMAGLTTALFTIPQGMAYALIAGFPPAAGLATSIVASILGAAFGSSEFLINGPTNAISVMLAANASYLALHGDPLQAVILLTFAIGVSQLAAGVLRLGALARFVSEPVLTGFTAGAGLYIVINQLPAFLGVKKAVIAHDLWGWQAPRAALFDLIALVRSLDHVHKATLALALLTFVTVRVLQRLERRLGRRLPATFLAVVLTTLIVWVLGLDHAGAAERVVVVRDIEPLTRSLPPLRFPNFDLSLLRKMVSPALAIALMGSVEAISIGKTLAARAGHSFDASRQLLGEGFCNLGAALVGGFASSGSFSRTAVNFEAGAVTRLSCILSGALACLIVLAFAPAANMIPIAALAGTLVHVGFKLVDVARLRIMFSTTSGDRAVLLTTFAGVLLAEHLENALFLGIAVSVYNALRRAEGFKLRVLAINDDGSLSEPSAGEKPSDSPVTLLNLQGELFFAAAEELHAELLRVLEQSAPFVVLRVQEAYNVDATTAGAIAQVAEYARKNGGRLLLCGVRPGMYGTFERGGLLDRIGQDAIFVAEREVLAATRKAVRYANELAGGQVSDESRPG